MSTCDFEPWTISSHKEPKARVEHQCEECNGRIRTGERYHRYNGLYEGQWDSYAICADCRALWCDVRRAEGSDCGVLIGGLSEAISDLDGEHSDRLRAAFDAVREARR